MTHYAPYFFQTGYSRYFYEYWLDKIGFTIIDMQWNGNYFEFLAQELQRLDRMNRQYGQRNLSPFEKLARLTLLRGLKRADHQNQGSEQLLSFGLHVMARKAKTGAAEEA